MIEERINKRKIDASDDLLSALKQMDKINQKSLLVFKENKFLNVLSVGDIQRSILKNIELGSPVGNVLRKNTRVARQTDSFEDIKEIMYEFRIECMPVLDEDERLINVYFWEDIFGENENGSNIKLDLPVVIMAGGKGTRLKPLTNLIPKPLIPVGDNTIIEEIMNRFVAVGCKDFHISVNYKSEAIRHYLGQLNNSTYQLNYFEENKPLGTAGSLYLLKDKIRSTFFVTNCDIIIDSDYSEMLKYHEDHENELTIIAALKHYPIPYGTIKTGSGGILLELLEKPELVFQINSGMYILEPHLLREIPEDDFFHVTHLVEKIKKRKGKVGVFPVSEGSWTDIGEWKGYLDKIGTSNGSR